MRFSLIPITRADVQAISGWRYDANPASVDSLLDPRFFYHSVYDGGDLVGYFCFGEDARVSAGRRLRTRASARRGARDEARPH